ncbi:hypothetical protein [Psychrobacter aestuarii]|uniref:Uncharacterized protein n=1 Tax=Psychrobacter aestuarii TaxID=556327 RepID=A0ABN0W3Y3_9GAMM|nr:hypothetical protein [Psychrobacter aestuarii]
MPQTSYELTVTDNKTAEKITQEGGNVQGVKWININADKGTIVVTHGEDYDEAAFKSIAGL